MSKQQLQVMKFHEAFGAPVADSPQLIEVARWELRHELIREELAEYHDACVAEDLVEVADALGDLLYLVCGAALEHGIDLEAVVDEIQASNMSKLGEDGLPVLRYDGKILKGPGYRRPDLAEVISTQGPDLASILRARGNSHAE